MGFTGIRHLFTQRRQRTCQAVQVLFYRDYQAFSGGHLKVWDYYDHVRAYPGFEPRIYFSPGSRWDSGNPWLAERHAVQTRWQPSQADYLFLAGTDWTCLPTLRFHQKQPIINLIQHVRHADPADPRYRFLGRKAIRICVSEEVADAIRATGKVNGPVFAIPNGLRTDTFPPAPAWNERTIDLLICALKNPEMGQRILDRLQQLPGQTRLLAQAMPRSAFLEMLSQSRVCLFLPSPTEGFYLPALEGMSLGCLVVCPDCIGNRSFCRPGENCFLPPYREDAILADVRAALELTPAELNPLLRDAQRVAACHAIDTERRKFWEVLENVVHIW